MERHTFCHWMWPRRSLSLGIVGRHLTILRRNSSATEGIETKQKLVTEDIINYPVTQSSLYILFSPKFVWLKILANKYHFLYKPYIFLLFAKEIVLTDSSIYQGWNCMNWLRRRAVVTGRILVNKNNSYHNLYMTKFWPFSFLFPHFKDILTMYKINF